MSGTSRVRSFVLGLAALVLFTVSSAGLRAADHLTEQPTERDMQIAKELARLVSECHISHREVDDELARRWFKMFFETLDPMKSYFLASDIEAARARETLIDDQVKAGDLSFAFDIVRLFIQRVNERIPLVHEFLMAEHDYSIDESLAIDPDHIAYCETPKEMRDRWRKRIKYDLLIETTSAATEEDEEQESKVELKPTPDPSPAPDSGEPQESADPDPASPQTAEPAPAVDPAVEAAQKLERARERLRKRYEGFAKRMAHTDNDELLEMYLSAMTMSYDPHTNYMSPHTFENFEINMSLELEGIGAELRSIDGYTTVMKIIAGGAASRDARLKPKDRIVAVGEGTEGPLVDVVDQKLSDVVPRIRGPRGSKVRLEVLTEGEQRRIYELERDKVELPESEATGEVFEIPAASGDVTETEPHRVGVIELPSFYRDMFRKGDSSDDFRSTTRDMRKIIGKFKDDRVGTLVLDLRRNGGGSLTEAINVAGLFLDGPMVQVKEFNGTVRSYNDEPEGIAWDGPLVVLVSRFSASASEIVAGAIQDYGRGLVVGDPATHGKGTVQSLLNLGDLIASTRSRQAVGTPKMGALKVTHQKFYRPSGGSTQGLGVMADIVLPSLTAHMGMTEGELDYALEYDTVERARFVRTDRINPAIIDEVRARSNARVAASADFEKLQANVERYRRLKDRKTVTLNRELHLAQRKEFDVSEEEEKVAESLDETAGADTNSRIQRTFYLEEVLRIAADLAQVRGKLAAK
ncbi:MAG: carboxy terminal-processing peptidase [Planctomycetota bacterium]